MTDTTTDALTFPKARDMMTTYVVCLSPEMSVYDATQLLREQHLHSAPVVDIGRQVIGYLSDGDCLKSLANTLFYGYGRSTVADVMSKDVVEVPAVDDLFEVESRFAAHGIRHAPVVDEEGLLVGMIARGDLLDAVMAMDPTEKPTPAVDPTDISLGGLIRRLI